MATIEQGNTELSIRTEQQATALQEIAASMDQLTATVKNNTIVANEMVITARQVESIARESDQAVQEVRDVIQKMATNADKVKEITGAIEGLASDKINEMGCKLNEKIRNCDIEITRNLAG